MRAVDDGQRAIGIFQAGNLQHQAAHQAVKMEEELLAQSVLTTSHDFAEFKAARAGERDPSYVRG